MNLHLSLACLSALAISLAIEVGAPIDAGAHGGGLNRQGCHNVRSTGGYHCHRSSYTPPAAQRAPEQPKRAPEQRITPRASTTAATIPSPSLLLRSTNRRAEGTQIQSLHTPGSAPAGSNIKAAPADSVLEVQRYLVYFGFDIGPVDGLMGVRTQAAIQSYQRTRSLKPSGEVSERLLNQMAIEINKPASNKLKLKQTFAPETTQENQRKLTERMQHYLHAIGLYAGRNDGIVTVELEQAIMRYQSANQISVDGKISKSLLSQIKSGVSR